MNSVQISSASGLHQLNIQTCTAQNCLESFIATFRWYCDHLHYSLMKPDEGDQSQHHRNVAIKDSEQFWAVHVQISSRCITTTATMTLKLHCYSCIPKLCVGSWEWGWQYGRPWSEVKINISLDGQLSDIWQVFRKVSYWTTIHPEYNWKKY